MNLVVFQLDLSAGILSQHHVDLCTLTSIEAARDAEVAEQLVVERFDPQLRIAEYQVVFIVGHRSGLGKQLEVDSVGQRYDHSSLVGSVPFPHATLAIGCQAHSEFGFDNQDNVGVSVHVVVEIIMTSGVILEQNSSLQYFSISVVFYTLP